MHSSSRWLPQKFFTLRLVGLGWLVFVIALFIADETDKGNHMAEQAKVHIVTCFTSPCMLPFYWHATMTECDKAHPLSGPVNDVNLTAVNYDTVVDAKSSSTMSGKSNAPHGRSHVLSHACRSSITPPPSAGNCKHSFSPATFSVN